MRACGGTWPRWCVFARSRAYDGIDLDYEHLALTSVAAARRPGAPGAFTGVRRTCLPRRCTRAGKRCVVTVMPRTSSRPEVWRHKLIPAVYDYARIGGRGRLACG